MEVLVEEGNAAVDALDARGRTPAQSAQQAGSAAVAEYLQVSSGRSGGAGRAGGCTHGAVPAPRAPGAKLPSWRGMLRFTRRHGCWR